MGKITGYQTSKQRKTSTAKDNKTRVGVYKANRRELRSIISVSSFFVKAGKLGKMRQTKIGARAGKHMFKGAFVATMRGGHKGIFTRMGKKSLPIEEEEFDLCDWKIVKRIADSE
ncbi:phage tail protein, partial [Wolbachia endosymbiont of Atemnus politus]|nr:phage tail protein [Wolbachia endosymbiont of Atemnus politus]